MNKLSLVALKRQYLDIAHTSPSGRSAQTVFGGHEHVLRQTLIALVGGQALTEHSSPAEATLYVLDGQIRLETGSEACDGSRGDLLIIPRAAHSVQALRDSVVLLTTVIRT